MKILKNIATSENGFVFNPTTGDSFSGNAMTGEILTLLKNGLSEIDIKHHILKIYDVQPAQLEKDWNDWSLQLQQANLLET